jgi:hypothetical protein
MELDNALQHPILASYRASGFVSRGGKAPTFPHSNLSNVQTESPVVGQFDCGRMTGLNGSAGGAYLENVRFVCAIDPRRIRLVAGLR